MKEINYEQTVKNIRLLLKNYIIKQNLKSLVIGVSGGIDSALVCALAKPVVDELGIPLIGRSISIESNKEDEKERARNIGKYFCTDFKEIDLTEHYYVLKDVDVLEGGSEEDTAYRIRMGNIKARMRMIYLYNIASKNGGLVLSTDNETELNCGYYTIFGDQGDFGMIQHLWKTEVYEMSEYISSLGSVEEHDALIACVVCHATDGLGITSCDLDQILPDWKDRHTTSRSGYKEIDETFIIYFELINKINNTVNAIERNELIQLVNIIKETPVIQRYFKTDFKRNHPIILKREDMLG
jgi:NAD+ synthase